jgi:molecular chaperone DnaK (HSP70)
MSDAGPIVGIDLGTTNSLVAVAGWPPGDPAGAAPRVIADEQGRALLPSAVRFEVGGRVEVGYDARDRAVEYPRTTVVSVKRLMGRSVQDAAADLKYLSYRVVEGPNRTARIELPGDGAGSAGGGAGGGEGGGVSRTVSPQEVSAIILRELKERASRALGVEVRRAVVTVPAYFDDAQRQATRDAGRLAGLEVVRIVNEPTAAALAYGVGLGAAMKPQTIVVYDLGGGTFDVSVLRLTPGAGRGEGAGADWFEVLATAGDTHLGGDDFDHALVQVFTDEIAARFFPGVGAPGGTAALGGSQGALFDPSTRRALRDLAERAKIRLSEAETASVRIEVGVADGGAAGVYERTVTRAEYEGLIGPLVERTIASCRRALRDARRAMGEEAVSCVVLVGGATRTPLVRRRVREFFGLEPYTALNPDEVVALGAAVQGSILSGASRSALLLDVVPLSLGVETVGGAVAKIIMRNSTVPARAVERFSTSVDGQASIRLNVVQGEREMAADCRSLGEFHLRGIPPMPAGMPRVVVEFMVDANGILNVSAVEERSGKRAELQVVPNHGLTREEVARMEAESVAHAREDMARHRVVDLAASASLDLGWIGKQLSRHGARLEAAERAALEARMEEVRAMVERAREDWRGVDANEFQRAKEALDRASVRLQEVAIAATLREEG